MSQARERRRQVEEKKEVAQEQSRQQRYNAATQNNLQNSSDRFEHEKAQYLDKLMETNMSDAGIHMLDNMVDRSFILGNISEAEYHDIKWEMHGMFIKIKANFPPQESTVTGDLRAFILDDENEGLRPLSGQQRTIIAQMIRGVTMLVSRSKDGFQQEMNVKSISVSEVMDPDQQNERSTMMGLFS